MTLDPDVSPALPAPASPLSPGSRRPTPVQLTAGGHQIHLPRRAAFFRLLERVADSGPPGKPRGRRAR